MASLLLELKFALKDKVVVVTLLAVFLLSSYTIINGLKESASELQAIERISELVDEDREYNLAKQSDAGSAAYYAFHFTYDAPSRLGFVSRGVRDELPWKHRIRMLALEGQIYESDSGNPELSRIGKLDFGFVASFLMPLLLILLVYDLRAVEVRNNRWALLSVTSGNGYKLLRDRAMLRSALLLISILIPFIIGAIVNGAGILGALVVVGSVALNIVLWCLIAIYLLPRVESGPTTAALLLGCWLAFAVVVPIGGKFIVEQMIATPKGGELLLTQREAVNDAWDLPKQATMTPFLKRHPQWTNTPEVARPFEWKWYYAFQQVGDQSVEDLSQQLRSGIRQRDRAMSFVSLISPPLLTRRLLTQAANTDISSFQRYDACVRNFHASLREFHYPMLFGNITYSLEKMQNLPTFIPCENNQ